MKCNLEPLEQRALFTGELDTTFGTGGFAHSDFDQFSEQFSTVAIAPDGKIVAAGFVGGAYLVARYTATGQLDTTFNNTGFVKTALTNYPASGVAVSPSGKIYVGGSQYLDGGRTNAYIAAYKADGSIDTTFDGDGVWSGSWAGNNRNTVAGLAFVQGRLYVGLGDDNSLGVARFTEAGAFDTSFGTAGTGKTLSYVGTSVTARDFVFATPVGGGVQLLVAGNNDSAAIVERFTGDGLVDAGFSHTTFASNFVITHMDVDPSGRVYVGGAAAQRADVVRLTNSGIVDASYGSNGSVLSSASAAYTVTSLVVTRDGEVLYTVPAERSGGEVGAMGAADYAIALTEAGTPNLTFGSQGQFNLPTANVGDAVRQNDGKIVLVGRQYLGGDQVDTELVRLEEIVPTTQISGYVFDDLNGDGVQNDASPRTNFPGVNVYLDQNDNGLFDDGEPSASAATGKFTFNNVGPATNVVRLLLTNGVTQTLPVNNGGLDVEAVKQFNSVGPFAVRFAPMTYDVAGVVFNDLDADGVVDAGETGLEGRIVYDDLNNNGLMNSGEPRATSGKNGFFSIALTSGNHNLRQFGAAGPHPTGQSLATAVNGSTFASDGVLRVPTDTSLNQVRIGLRPNAILTTVVFNDLDGDGTRDADEPLIKEGGFAFDDRNNNGIYDNGDDHDSPVGTLELLPGTHTIRQSLDAGWVGTSNGGSVVIGATTNTATITFGRRQPPVKPVGASVQGNVYSDANRNAQRTLDEADLSGIVVYIDLDNDKVLDANETRTTTDVTGHFAFEKVPDTGSATRLRIVVPANMTQTQPANGFGYALNLVAGAVNTGLNFGLYAPPVTPPAATGTLAGFLYNDNNANGTFDGNDTKTPSGRQVFFDLDGDNALDANERVVTTDANGAWSFGNVAAGTYHIRRVFPSGYVLSSQPLDVALAAGQSIGDLSIGAKAGATPPVVPPVVPPTVPTTAVIKGRAFDDKNGNGKFDLDDSYTGGKRIFLDLDGDGVWDSNEASVLTDAAGNFAFSNLKAGTYKIGRVFNAGYTYSTPKPVVTVAAGQTFSGVLIGTKKA